MNILVIGGSYFLGKHFVLLASKDKNVTVFNRGNRALGMENVIEITGDRNKKEDLEKLKSCDVDVVVDFCAYGPGDIANVIDAIGSKIKQYIFISTVDAYKKGTNTIIDENSPLETTIYGGEIGQYIAGKVALEHELEKCAAENGIAFTSVRPAIIYGPDNYAPREGIFFNWIDKAGQVLAPKDESGFFRMVYVDDLASVILNLCGNEDFYNKAVNVCGAGLYNYKDLFDALSNGCGLEFQTVELPVAEIIERGIALPFPLTKEESEEYRSLYEDELKCDWTSLEEGMKRAYEAYQ